MPTAFLTLASGWSLVSPPGYTATAMAVACAVLAAWSVFEMATRAGDLGTHEAVQRSRMLLGDIGLAP